MNAPQPPAYNLRTLEQMLGISRSVITALVAAGFVRPARGPRNEYLFTFQDMVLLRAAYGLQSARIAPRKIVNSLQRLKASLPQALPLSGLRITAVGSRVAVRHGATQWEPESGQLLFDFEVSPQRGSVQVLHHATRTKAAAAPPAASAGDLFRQGEREEARDKAAAERAYRQAVALAPDHADAYLNLGAMLCEAGRCDEALALYDKAIVHCALEPSVHFNRAIALEDLGRPEEALASYERCLALSPGLADAHYNAARLYEQLGQAQRALRHFREYRRLQR